MREAVVFDSFPSPALSHSDSMSRIDSPRTNAPITIARNGSVRNTFALHGNSFETNGSAASLICGSSTTPPPASAPCAAESRCAARADSPGRRS
jgi:hypothetical protein